MDLDDLLDPFRTLQAPVGEWIEAALLWLVDNFRDFFQALKQPISLVLEAIQHVLTATPPLCILIIIGLLAWQLSGRRIALIALGCFIGIGVVGAWTDSMITLSIVLTAIFFCTGVGIPVGILASRSDRFAAVLRPVLDLMQTIPSFVYLVPVVMLFGIGNVAGVIVTIIYALSPVIRLTNLGIRQVRAEMVEAARAFGASDSQILFKVQIPLAAPTIMAGVNQTIMMALSMVVVASMISVTGLGEMVLRGIGRLDMGIATVGGFGIVLLAIAIDRVTQGATRSSRERGRHKWYEAGPVGAVVRLWRGTSRQSQNQPISRNPSLGIAAGVIVSGAEARHIQRNTGDHK